MRVGIVILCRFNSSRLPGKILKFIDDKPVLGHIYTRIRKLVPAEDIVVATSEELTDQPIVDFCSTEGINCYQGSLENVADRFLSAGQKQGFDYLIRINGDNLFIDLELLKEIISVSKSGEFDFISNVPGRTFPYGMSVESVNRAFYEKKLESFTEQRYKEHVTLYFYENEAEVNHKYYTNTSVPEIQGKKMAIDTKEDFELLSSLFKSLGDKRYDYNLITLCNKLLAL